MDQVEVNAQDIIDALTSQRNAAMDELTKQAAIIRALQRKLEPPSPDADTN